MLSPTEFLDLLPFGAYHTTPDGEILYANQALVDLLGYPSIEKMTEGTSRYFYVDLADREEWQRLLAASTQGSLRRHTMRWRRFDGQAILVENSGRIVHINGTIVYEGVVVLVSEVPTPVAARASPLPFHLSDESLHAVFEQLPICVSRKDDKRRIVWANDTFCRLEDISLNQLLSVKFTDELLYGRETAEIYRHSDEVVLRTGQPHQAIETHRFGDGRRRKVRVLKVPLFDPDTKIINGLEIFFWDVDGDGRSSERRRRASRLKNILKSKYIATFEYDLNGTFRAVSETAAELVGRPRDKWKGLHLSDVVASDYIDVVKTQIRNLKNSAKPSEAETTFEIDILGIDNQRIPVEAATRLLVKNGTPVGVMSFIRDLSARRDAEQRRLREIHHRVKNNLYTIGSLLSREADRSESAETRDILEACEARVSTMALLHEHLYQASRVDQIDAVEYFRKLVDSLVLTYQRPWQRIQVRVNVENTVSLSLDVTEACALVLHELISNSLKHAFPRKLDGERHGTVLVTLKNTGERKYQLTVVDTGIGMSEPIEMTTARSMGMRLVYGIITTQLSGNLQIDSGHTGTSVCAVFFDRGKLGPVPSGGQPE